MKYKHAPIFLVVLCVSLCGCKRKNTNLNTNSNTDNNNTNTQVINENNNGQNNEPNKVTVTFKNYDESVLDTQQTTPGGHVSYAGVTPVKPSENDEFTYKFTGKWSLTNGGNDYVEFEYVLTSFDVYAVYEQIVNTFTVRFLDENNIVLSENVYNYGTSLTPPTMPDKEITNTTITKFLGWDLNKDGVVDELPATVTTNIVAVAVYAQQTRIYKITYFNTNNEIYYVQEGEYLTDIVKPNPLPDYDDQNKEGVYWQQYAWEIFRGENNQGQYIGVYYADIDNWNLQLNANYSAYPKFDQFNKFYNVKIYGDEEKTSLIYDNSVEGNSVYNGNNLLNNAGIPAPNKESTGSRIYVLTGYNIEKDPNYNGQYKIPDFIRTDESFFLICDVVLVPVFEEEIITHKVTYHVLEMVNGEKQWTERCQIEVEHGQPSEYPYENPQLIPTTTGKHYVFHHWTDSFNGQVYNDLNFGTTPITQDTNLYAQYSNEWCVYTVYYYNDDGTELLYTFGNVIYPDVYAYHRVDNPTKEPDSCFTYTFSHWATEIGGTEPYFIANLTSDINLYAVYNRQYIPRFDEFYPGGYINIGINQAGVFYYRSNQYDNPTVFQPEDFVYDGEVLEFKNYIMVKENFFGHGEDGYIYNINDPFNITRVFDKKMIQFTQRTFIDENKYIYFYKGTDLSEENSLAKNILLGDNPYVKVEAPEGVKFDYVADNYNNIYGVSTDGDLYSMGYASEGRLGRGTSSESFELALAKINTGTLKFKSVSCGLKSVFAISTEGNLYTWGSNMHRTCGLPTLNEIVESPTQILENLQFRKVVVFQFDVVALTEDNKLYVWGANQYYQLGMSTKTAYPQQVRIYDENENEVEITDIGMHWYFVSVFANNRMYYCNNLSGQNHTFHIVS